MQVKAGAFQMGSSLDEVDRTSLLDETPHLVTLTQDFEIQTTEVTQLQYFLLMDENPSYFSKEKYCPEDYSRIERYSLFRRIEEHSLCSNHPVERVSWNQVQKFISLLNKKDDKYTYRLPTETEWEYAARGCQGSSEPRNQAYCTSTAFNLGDGISRDEVNYKGNYPYKNEAKGIFRKQTVRVGSLPNKNNLGLYDMHGNVAEWVQDRYGEYPYENNPVVDPQGALSGLSRVIRGGSWNNVDWDVRSAHRNHRSPFDSGPHMGFRLARTVKK